METEMSNSAGIYAKNKHKLSSLLFIYLNIQYTNRIIKQIFRNSMQSTFYTHFFLQNVVFENNKDQN